MNICQIIGSYKTGDTDALSLLYSKLSAMHCSITRKAHFMEYDDAFQEYALCILYFRTCLRHKFCELYKKHRKMQREFEPLIEETIINPTDPYNECIYQELIPSIYQSRSQRAVFPIKAISSSLNCQFQSHISIYVTWNSLIFLHSNKERAPEPFRPCAL